MENKKGNREMGIYIHNQIAQYLKGNFDYIEVLEEQNIEDRSGQLMGLKLQQFVDDVVFMNKGEGYKMLVEEGLGSGGIYDLAFYNEKEGVLKIIDWKFSELDYDDKYKDYLKRGNLSITYQSFCVNYNSKNFGKLLREASNENQQLKKFMNQEGQDEEHQQFLQSLNLLTTGRYVKGLTYQQVYKILSNKQTNVNRQRRQEIITYWYSWVVKQDIQQIKSLKNGREYLCLLKYFNQDTIQKPTTRKGQRVDLNMNLNMNQQVNQQEKKDVDDLTKQFDGLMSEKK